MANTIYKIVIFDAEENRSKIYPAIYWDEHAAIREARSIGNTEGDYPDGSMVYVHEEQADRSGQFLTSRTIYTHCICNE